MAKFTIVDDRTLMVEDAEICYKNFSGEKTPMNDEGKRNFNLVIRDPELAEELTKLNYRIKPKKSEPNTWTLKVHLNMGSPYPAEVYYITGSGKKVIMTENNIHQFNRIKMKEINIQINGSRRKDARDKFLNAYVDVMVVFGAKDVMREKFSKFIDDVEEETDVPFDM